MSYNFAGGAIKYLPHPKATVQIYKNTTGICDFTSNERRAVTGHVY